MNRAATRTLETGGTLERVVVDCPQALAGHAQRIVLAIGVFDGVHIGHQAIFRELLDLAEEKQAQPAVLFFEPHPRAVLQPGQSPGRLTDIEERMRLMEQSGIRLFVCFPFTREIAALSPEAFCKGCLDVANLEVCGYCVGENWRFGQRNAGDGAALRQLTGKTVRIVPSARWNGETISSTRIREAIADGRVRDAAAMLGRPYSLNGTVEHGQGKGGPVLSYPTANLDGGGLQLPRFGVYAARGFVDGVRHDGIAYVGDAPTLRGHDIIVEYHIFDFAGDLYGRGMNLEFVEFLRPSIRFADAEALKQQIDKDILQAKEILAQTP